MRYRESNTNLRTQFNRIIRRAGHEPWPKLFQNLRSTRETELAEHFPLHVVTAWIGNSELVAAKHYLQLTDDHFIRAIGGQAAQNAAQKLREPTRKAAKKHPAYDAEDEPNAAPVRNLQPTSVHFSSGKVPEVGLEPTWSITSTGF